MQAGKHLGVHGAMGRVMMMVVMEKAYIYFNNIMNIKVIERKPVFPPRQEMNLREKHRFVAV